MVYRQGPNRFAGEAGTSAALHVLCETRLILDASSELIVLNLPAPSLRLLHSRHHSARFIFTPAFPVPRKVHIHTSATFQAF